MSSKKKKDSKKGAGGGGTGANWPSPGSGSGVAAGSLPEPAKSRLWELFGAIEREFEQLHADNGALRERLDKLELLTERDRGSADNTADSTNTSYVVATETPLDDAPSEDNEDKKQHKRPDNNTEVKDVYAIKKESIDSVS
ncbi:hypothetical protein GBAR_LOCUS22304 [Geodia barretti]|uniref:Uncharacterized protein n=1 Tax=Geodia barretti TaxID=519541 RepID=A0AA35T2L8_GEOBA|nr:hypothetical protein GBAR_LOCUS22304 [Geodia barretti]